jgi:hypothetical protein
MSLILEIMMKLQSSIHLKKLTELFWLVSSASSNISMMMEDEMGKK